ncbi:MAG: hypothetical protein IK132_10520, partial [Clostridia bacterium]|nr:hypothetical protein [Clostridia bacterium]
MAAVVRYVEYYYNRTVNRCQPIWKNFVEKLCGFRSYTEKTGAFRRKRSAYMFDQIRLPNGLTVIGERLSYFRSVSV